MRERGRERVKQGAIEELSETNRKIGRQANPEARLLTLYAVINHVVSFPNTELKCTYA